jgi:hypothetical protein
MTDLELFDSYALSVFREEKVLAVADPFNDRIFFGDWLEFIFELTYRIIIHESLHLAIYKLEGERASQALDIFERDHVNPFNFELLKL